ncbi:hypothetical protein SDJN03_14639, partial [Cucurbita argyrosperma subsp. sororia]
MCSRISGRHTSFGSTFGSRLASSHGSQAFGLGWRRLSVAAYVSFWSRVQTERSGSSAVSCKQSPNEGEFLDYQSSELRTANSECFLTHSGGWDSKSPRIVNCPSLEPETALASRPELNLEPKPDPKSKIGCEAESFLESEDKLVEEKHLESDNGRREVESENLDQVQKDSFVVEAELLDKSMDDEHDVVADEGYKLEDSLVGEREQGNGMDDKNSLESSVQLDDECKESKDLDQEVKTRDFDVSDKEVEKEMSDGETTKTTKTPTQNFRDKGKRVAETSKNKKKKKKSGRTAQDEDDLDKILAELGEGPTISKQADPPLSSQEAKVENPPDLVTPPDASAKKEAEEESTDDCR